MKQFLILTKLAKDLKEKKMSNLTEYVKEHKAEINKLTKGNKPPCKLGVVTPSSTAFSSILSKIEELDFSLLEAHNCSGVKIYFIKLSDVTTDYGVVESLIASISTTDTNQLCVFQDKREECNRTLFELYSLEDCYSNTELQSFPVDEGLYKDLYGYLLCEFSKQE